MKSTHLANVLFAMTAAFSVATQAAQDVSKAYTLKTQHGDFAIPPVTGTKSAFQAASEIVAAKTKDETLKVGWKTNNFIHAIAKIIDSKGTKVGECTVIGEELDNWKQAILSKVTLGIQKDPIHYKAYCWDGTNNDKTVSAQTPFTYDRR